MKARYLSALLRMIAPVFLLVGAAVALSPVDTTAQMGECWECDNSPFAPGSTICRGAHAGLYRCTQVGTPNDHECIPTLVPCDDGVLVAADQQAIETIKAGEMLAGQSSYFVLAGEHDVVLMRECGAVVARLSMRESELAHDGLDWEAMRVTEEAGHPENRLTISDSAQRRAALEQ